MKRSARRARIVPLAVFVALCASSSAPLHAQNTPSLAQLKTEVATEIDGLQVFTQRMVDQVFSFGELGFQEFETSKYLTNILRQNGFTVQQGIAGIPTSWMATWGSGKPVIAFGSDIDGIPQGSQKPGVAYHDPLIEGAPGHGEGHNSGQALNITAALELKKKMQQYGLSGTIKLWPGVAEELLGTKAFLVRDGYLKDVDVVLYSHVGSNFDVNWGEGLGNGLVSIEYSFRGESAHAGNQPWRGKSALDAVELMDIGWNFRREHLRIQQRSHYVITDGGNQPNVVPPTASVWYYFRETNYKNIKDLWDIGDTMARGAAMMTGTDVTSRLLGAAWPLHMNKPLSEAAYENITAVGLPSWSDADQTLARAIQHELGVEEIGLAREIAALRGRSTVPDEEKRGGGSDDVGDISWNVPTMRLGYPANIEGGPGHNWANAITMATPIAHKGTTAGAKVMAMTALDIVMKPELVQQAWDYFRNVQTKDITYTPLIRAEDRPAIWLNEKTMAQYREQMKKFYYDPAKYKTYLEQLGITYPTLRPASGAASIAERPPR